MIYPRELKVLTLLYNAFHSFKFLVINFNKLNGFPIAYFPTDAQYNYYLLFYNILIKSTAETSSLKSVLRFN